MGQTHPESRSVAMPWGKVQGDALAKANLVQPLSLGEATKGQAPPLQRTAYSEVVQDQPA